VKQRLQWLANRIDALSARERALLFLALAFIVYMLWSSLFMGPLNAQHSALQQQIQAVSDRNAGLQQQVATILARQSEDPNRQTRLNIAKAEGQVHQLDQQLHEQAAHFIPPKEMAHVLERVLLDSKGLKLVSAGSMAPIPLLIGSQTASGGEPVRIYKHGLRLTFQGSYLDTLAYLKKLEALPWKLFWGSIRYTVDDFPRAHCEIEVYTLSFDETWIGV